MSFNHLELVTPRVVSAPRAAAGYCAESLLIGGDCTHWASEDEDPVDNHFVFDFGPGKRSAPGRIEWSDWGREDGAAFMKLAVSDELHTGWTRVCGWSTQQTSNWQFHDVAQENRCLGRYWKVTIKRAHRPGFGLQLRGLRLHVCGKPASPNSKHVQPSQVGRAVPHDNSRLAQSTVSSRLLDAASCVELAEQNCVELVKQLRAENEELTTKFQNLQSNMAKEHAQALAERDMHLHALQQQVQEETKKAMREQARAQQLEGEVLHLRWKLNEKHSKEETNNTSFERDPAQYQFIARERDEAVRARKHLESALSQVLSSQGWHAAPVNEKKLSRKSTPELSPLPSTQASTQVSPEPTPPSSPRMTELEAYLYDGTQVSQEPTPPSSPRMTELEAHWYDGRNAEMCK
jgi:hypothetical protein